MIFEIDRASVMFRFYNKKNATANEILEKLNLPKGYDVRVDMNHTIFNEFDKKEYIDPKVYIKINTLEELITFMREVKHDLVFDKDENKIIIYDDWIE